MEFTSDLEADLNALVNEYGLISTLDALRQLVDDRASSSEAVAADPDPSLQEQTEAFREVARALETLVKILPPELDYELALEQIAHTSTDLNDSDETLSYGQLS